MVKKRHKRWKNKRLIWQEQKSVDKPAPIINNAPRSTA
ncbi:hypothetical protein O23A_p3605 [Aeromonas salmonicida]|nr:hypothetical protein O23A_p3605 [Aeromonas salmonicida]